MYTYKFGLQVLRILPKLQSTVCQNIPPTPPTFDALEYFKGMDDGDFWLDAKMNEVISYLYGNRYIKIPQEWKDAL